MQRGMEMGDAPRASTQTQSIGFFRLIPDAVFRFFSRRNNNQENFPTDVPLDQAQILQNRS